MDKKDEKKEPKKVVAKQLPTVPKIYVDGDINMHSSMIRSEEEFIQLWKGSTRQNLKKAYERATKWRSKYAK